MVFPIWQPHYGRLLVTYPAKRRSVGKREVREGIVTYVELQTTLPSICGLECREYLHAGVAQDIASKVEDVGVDVLSVRSIFADHFMRHESWASSILLDMTIPLINPSTIQGLQCEDAAH